MDIISSTPSSDPTSAMVDGRVVGILGASAAVGTGVPVPSLTELLPDHAPSTPEAVTAWLRERPDLAQLLGDRVFAPSLAPSGPETGRLRRGEDYYQQAETLRDSLLRPVLPWVLTLGVTGSAAYGEPEAGDDLDFLVVTRSGSLWVVLTYLYIVQRVRPRRVVDGRPLEICLNYARDADEAAGEFAGPQDFLFAREALMARIVHGEEYYAGLLASATWMEREIPRLYRRRRGHAPVHPPNPAPWTVRVLNLLIFPLVAAYLQGQGLVRNAALRRSGTRVGGFRSQTRLHRLSFVSERFERLRSGYALPWLRGATPSASPSSRVEVETRRTPPQVSRGARPDLV